MHHLKTKGNTDFAGTNTYVFNKSLNPGLEILCVLLFYLFHFNLTPPQKKAPSLLIVSRGDKNITETHL